MNKHSATNIPGRRTIELATVLACCLVHHLNSALAAPGSWTRKANMPMAIAIHAACAVDGILYVVGGDNGTSVASMTQLQSLFAYDPKTDLWTRKQDMPTPRRFLAAAAVDGIIYVIGGGGMGAPVTGAVEAYDPKTDTWVAKTEMLTPRCLHAACAVDGIIYAIGGVIAVGSSPLVMKTVEAYDPKTDQWTPKAQLPVAASFGAAQAVNGVIYAFTGKRIFAYDPQTDNWTTKAQIPNWSLNCRGSASSVADGIVYLFGGTSADMYTTYDLTLAYDPSQNSFSAKRRMPMPAEAAACATIDGKIYVTGGADGDPSVHATIGLYNSLWMFDPQGGVTPQIIQATLEGNNGLRLRWRGEVGRLYGLEFTRDPVNGPWTRDAFLPNLSTVAATNELVEAGCLFFGGEPGRFYRVFDAN